MIRERFVELDYLLAELVPHIFGKKAMMQSKLQRAQAYAAEVRRRKGWIVSRLAAGTEGGER